MDAVDISFCRIIQNDILIENREHHIIEDYIDIDPDKSVQIFYCDVCLTTFPSLDICQPIQQHLQSAFIPQTLQSTFIPQTLQSTFIPQTLQSAFIQQTHQSK